MLNVLQICMSQVCRNLINRVKLGRMFHAQNLKAFIKARMSF